MRRSWIFLLALWAYGCMGSFSVIGFAGNGQAEPSAAWNASPAPPHNRLEELACAAAEKNGRVSEGGVSAAFLWSEGSYDVAAVAEDLQETPDRFAPRRIRYYRILSGEIAGSSSPVVAPSPDGEFERAIFLAARNAGTMNPVMPYDDGIHPVTLKAERHGCRATVTVIDGFDPQGEVLFERNVNICEGAPPWVEE